MKTDYSIGTVTARLSVREFVEFVCRSGDLVSGGTAVDTRAMREGVRLHKMIQNSQPEGYTAEAVLEAESLCVYEDEEFLIKLEGRADGIINIQNPIEKFEYDNKELALFDSLVFIDEIKCMYAKVEEFTEPEPVHLAQAKCYAFFLAEREELERIGVQMTYCNIDSERVRYFCFEFTRQELGEWFNGRIWYFAKWLHWQKKHLEGRNQSIKKMDFPFPYRPGQKELVKNIYLSILREKKIFIEAPTGVGKTISSVFPAVKALGEGLCSRIFYATAKTITRTVAEETAETVKKAGADLMYISLTAKEKICIFDKSDCNPVTCERARGYEDRINEAVFDIINNESSINRQKVEEYAAKHKVCPYEYSLEISLWCDMLICDYNYCFDPDVYLRRFFSDDHIGEYVLLADEAHNLVDRAREMYSSSLSAKRLKEVRPLYKEREDDRRLFTRIASNIEKLAKENVRAAENREGGFRENRMNRMTVGRDECMKVFSLGDKLLERLKAYVSDRKREPEEELLDFFFELRSFMMTAALMDENYVITVEDYGADSILRLNCMNPRSRLSEYMQFFRGKALFSATLLPVNYYMEQLDGDEEDYAVYAPSPFRQENRLILVAGDVSAKYSRRTREEFEKHMDYIDKMIHAKTGNYLVFFPSYKVMDDIYQVFLEEYGGFEENFDFTLVKQKTDMSEEEREKFLSAFVPEPEKSCVGFCVMGGIFSEGIDLRSDRLIGVAIVGTGLPMVGEERELFKNFYDMLTDNGFEHAYLWPGMNKVLQAGGRVIRTESDRGVILLLDERFLNRTYNSLFPNEWNNYIITDRTRVESDLDDFWSQDED